MKKFTFNNPKELALSSIEQRLKISFKGVPFQYYNSATSSIDSEDSIIESVGSEIIATINENLPEINEIKQFLTELLAPNYHRLLLEFGDKFRVIDNSTVVETPPSSVSIHINDKPAAALRLWLNSDKQPHEIEIIPYPSEEGNLLSKWVKDNKRDILKTEIYVAGELVRMVTII
ncbi:hypothetical protein N180_15535 [Pedobacter antarcticus 4BY]|uniref:Uncharacterized protein n=2 Tax=Pedobacter antarcticus TaxID=34086 RepID=A0A081PLS6_9SPHI|nr:hypothetical protein [Pedobacter antarcticus]KEQ31649.1 hypothetical protein N180_15535 [Pedobacter antarcticus 4BY]SFE33587.1 hypothetical protein SAMN03003324_00124 [Pedobacter antarcticus]